MIDICVPWLRHVIKEVTGRGGARKHTQDMRNESRSHRQ